jgi:hypothetical protein
MAGGQSLSIMTDSEIASLTSGRETQGPETIVLDKTNDASAKMCETHGAGGILPRILAPAYSSLSC